MTFLYTLPNCPTCEKTRVGLEEDFTEVVIDNPLLRLGVQALLRKPEVVAPLLVRPGDRGPSAYYVSVSSSGNLTFTKILTNHGRC